MKANDEESQQFLLPVSTNDANKVDIWKRFNSFASCAVFSLCSISMVLINKYITTAVDSRYRDHIPNIFIVWYQCFLAVLLLYSASLAGYIVLPEIEWKTTRAWLPINLLFIAMLITSFVSFVHLSVPMITIIKNLTNVITVSGDRIFFGER